MNVYKPGEYIIIKKSYWCHSEFDLITILTYDEDDIIYQYSGDNKIRRRQKYNFDSDFIVLVPVSTLTKELL